MNLIMNENINNKDQGPDLQSHWNFLNNNDSK